MRNWRLGANGLTDSKFDTVVIAAGGLGTRLRSRSGGKPKALIEFEGVPLLIWQLRQLMHYNFTKFFLLTGYGHHDIESAVASYKLDCSIDFVSEDVPLGNGGCLINALDKLPENFIYLYCDVIFDIDFEKFIEFHLENDASLSLFTHPNDHPYDSDLLEVNKSGEIVEIHHPPNLEKDIGNNANAAVYIVNKSVFNKITNKLTKLDFMKDIVTKLIGQHKVIAYRSAELVKDIGTINRFDVAKTIYEFRLKRDKNPIIFLDRDGTINNHTCGEDILKPDDFILLPKVAEAIKIIRQKGYFIVVVTNQPCVAKGYISANELHRIHNKMESLLGHSGAYVDAIYTCYHHPEQGFAGEVPELKIVCSCRKPEIGLLAMASDQIPVDKRNSWIVGDTWRDVLAGQKFEVNTCLIADGNSNSSKYHADKVLPSVFEFALVLPDRREE